MLALIFYIILAPLFAIIFYFNQICFLKVSNTNKFTHSFKHSFVFITNSTPQWFPISKIKFIKYNIWTAPEIIKLTYIYIPTIYLFSFLAFQNLSDRTWIFHLALRSLSLFLSLSFYIIYLHIFFDKTLIHILNCFIWYWWLIEFFCHSFGYFTVWNICLANLSKITLSDCVSIWYLFLSISLTIHSHMIWKSRWKHQMLTNLI